MKKILILAITTLLLTGCTLFQSDKMTNIKVATGVYPVDYMTNYLYHDYATIDSIYPLDTNYASYKLNKQQITAFSKNDLFVFAGTLPEKNYAIDMLEQNESLKIIDATYKLNYEYDANELWLNPSNAIMVAKNIKNGLNEYISNPYLRKRVTARFNSFNAKMTEIDAEYRLMVDNSVGKTLVFTDDSFTFYQKYGFNVISIENTKYFTQKKFNDVKDLLAQGKVKFIYVTKDEPLSAELQSLQKTYPFEIVYIDAISKLTDKDNLNKEDYLSKMLANKELLKKELYR